MDQRSAVDAMIRLLLKYLAACWAGLCLLGIIVLGIMALSIRGRTEKVLASRPVSISAGTFIMGCVSGDDTCDLNEPPARTMALPAFKIDRFPVTNAAYRKCVESRACPMPHLTGGLGGFCDALKPVIGVTWNEADNYCAWRGGMLPSEAQWERAARGVKGALWPWGDDFSPGRACASIPPLLLKGPCPVDRHPEGISPDGVMDMAGNVWEWTSEPASPAARDASGPAPATGKVFKGGSWMDRENSFFRASGRYSAPEDYAAYNVGFRCAYP